MGDLNFDWLGNILNSSADAYVKIKGANALDDGQNNGTIPLYSGGGTTGGISPAILLLGAGLILFMFLKD